MYAALNQFIWFMTCCILKYQDQMKRERARMILFGDRIGIEQEPEIRTQTRKPILVEST